MQTRHVLRDRRGSVAIIFVTMSICLIWFLIVIADLGAAIAMHQELQGANDLAAIAAATNLLSASNAAAANVSHNGFQASEVTSITAGTYSPNPTITPIARFQPAPLASANAIKVTMLHQQSSIFPAFVDPLVAITLSTQAIAYNLQTASFGIGSGVAALNGGVANTVLSAMLGGQVALSALDYQSLASAQIDLFGLAKALALLLNEPNASYAQVFGTTITMSQFAAALQQVAPASSALSSIVSAASAGAATVDLTRLLEFGPYSSMAATGNEPAQTATASLLTLLQAAGDLGGGSHVISLNATSSIPGIASFTGLMTIGEPPQQTTVLGIDKVGTTIHTAQIRLYLNLALSTLVDGGVVNLPLYLEIGSGTAVLTSISCTPLGSSGTTVTLSVTPGLVNGWIGSVTPAAMTNYSAEPTPLPATLLNVAGLVTVTGFANAAISNLYPSSVSFSQSDINGAVVKTTSTNDFVASLINTLLGKLAIYVNVIGLPILVPPGLANAVVGVLNAAANPADQLITSVLQAAGLDLGFANTWVTGAHCGVAALVE